METVSLQHDSRAHKNPLLVRLFSTKHSITNNVHIALIVRVLARRILLAAAARVSH